MYDNLEKLMKKKALVALYTNESNDDAFSVGYICELEHDRLLFLNVGVHGEYDGYTAMNIKHIFRVETNSNYLQKMKKLISFDMNEKKLKVSRENVFVFLIDKAINDNKITVIRYINDCEIRGHVKEAKDVLSIVEVDEYGYEDGENIINLDNINKVVIDDVECRDIEKLYKINKKDTD